MIPKIIHQTWKSETLPPVLKMLYDENVNFLKNKGYTFKFWCDKDIIEFINSNYPNYYNIYSFAKTGVQRGDISRILLVNHYGGIYIDLDVLIMKDFADLIDFNEDKFYISYEPSGQTNALYNDDKYLCNAFFASNKNNKFTLKLVRGISDYVLQHGVTIFNKFDIFGGNYIKQSMKNFQDKDKYIHIIDDRELIYPINDLKLDNMPFTNDDWNILKKGIYPMDPVMIHYWIHGDFESKNVINQFTPNKNLNVHDNMYMFFKTLYPNIAKKIDYHIK